MHPEAARVYDRITGGLARKESMLREYAGDDQMLHTHLDGIETARRQIEMWRAAEIAAEDLGQESS